MISSIENNHNIVLFLLILAVFRIYLEVIKFNFSELPMTKSIFRGRYQAYGQSFHRMGFFVSVGYFLLFAPGYILS